MAEYLAELGNEATLGDAFHALYDQVKKQTEDLESEAANLESRHYGSGLLMRELVVHRLQTTGTAGKGINEVATIATFRDFRWTHLSSITDFRKGSDTEPIRHKVQGYRAHETRPDYALIVHHLGSRAGRIECRLARNETQPIVRSSSDEPIGSYYFDQSEQIARLSGSARTRVDIIIGGIVGRIKEVEELKSKV